MAPENKTYAVKLRYTARDKHGDTYTTGDMTYAQGKSLVDAITTACGRPEYNQVLGWLPEPCEAYEIDPAELEEA